MDFFIINFYIFTELENSIDKSKEEIEALQEKVSVLSVQLIGCASATFSMYV